jgi:hypothetical protein
MNAISHTILHQSFGWQTFKRVGASLTIRRIYRNVLMLSIVIQLSVFFMCTTVLLWIDQLWNGNIGPLAKFITLYKATSIVTVIVGFVTLLLPQSPRSPRIAAAAVAMACNGTSARI